MFIEPHVYGCKCEQCAGMVAAILACNSDGSYFFSDQELAQMANESKPVHKCKLHNYEHDYVRHVCGHEYCPQVWKSCPRCYGSHAENQKLCSFVFRGTKCGLLAGHDGGHIAEQAIKRD